VTTNGPQRWRRAGRTLARLQLALTLLLWAAAILLWVAGDRRESDSIWSFPEIAVAPSFGLAGLFLASRVPGHQVGRLLRLIAMASAIYVCAAEYAMVRAPWTPHGLPAGRYAGWVASWIFLFPFTWVLTLLPLIFPDGRPPSPRWRPITVAAAVLPVVVAGAVAVRPGPMEAVPVDNPFGLPAMAGIWPSVEQAFSWLLLAGMAAAFAAIVVRARRAGPDERRQLMWFGVAVLGIVALAYWPSRLNPSSAVMVAGVLLIPAACALAIVRYRLYTIDIIVNWALVHAVAVAAIIGIYLAVSAALASAIGQDRPPWLALLAFVAAAAAFSPLRIWSQRLVDQLIYRDRGNPYRIVAAVGDHVAAAASPQEAMAAAAQVLLDRMPLSAVAIEPAAGTPIVQVGQPSGVPELFPLIWQTQHVGALRAWPRPTVVGLSRTDRRVLGELAHNVAPIVWAARTTAELRQSGQRMAEAREEERRRLRRDLHDGLGPTLAGITLGAEAARTQVAAAFPDVGELLARLRDAGKGASADVRRLVYDMRPPALDEFGLVEAIRQHTVSASSRIPITVTADSLPPLPAATEVAALRIVTEALANVYHHSQARTAAVRLSTSGQTLEVTIDDDGEGIPPQHQPGVGLTSMRERAAELGGTCVIVPRPTGGTRVLACLPTATGE
jgi:two-component system NarL family sensor kinase